MLGSKQIVTLEGNIGSGKSTTLNLLKQKVKCKNFVFAAEPVEDFSTCQFGDLVYNPLEEFYLNPHENACAFQFWINRCYSRQLEKITKECMFKNHFLFDRGIYSSSVFIKALTKQGFLSDFSSELLLHEVNETIYKYYGGDKIFGTNRLYYLDTPIDVCLRRIQSRSRKGEVDTKNLRDQLVCIHNEYEKYIDNFINLHGVYSFRRFYHEDENEVANDLQRFITKFNKCQLFN